MIPIWKQIIATVPCKICTLRPRDDQRAGVEPRVLVVCNTFVQSGLNKWWANGRDAWKKCHVPSAGNQSATTARRDGHKSPFGLSSYGNLWSAFSKMSVAPTEFTVTTDQVPSGFSPVPRRIEAQCKAGRAWLGLPAMNRAPLLWGTRTSMQLLLWQGPVKNKERVTGG